MNAVQVRGAARAHADVTLARAIQALEKLGEWELALVVCQVRSDLKERGARRP
jgi:hypothetical protein